jgi:hypothetical protein
VLRNVEVYLRRVREDGTALGKAPLAVWESAAEGSGSHHHGVVIEGHQPRFMELAREVIQLKLPMEDDRQEELSFCELCLRTMFKEHKRTAAMITDDGPLSVENLYKNRSVENREWTRDYLKKTAELSKDVNASLKELFVAQGCGRWWERYRVEIRSVWSCRVLLCFLNVEARGNLAASHDMFSSFQQSLLFPLQHSFPTPLAIEVIRPPMFQHHSP